MLIEELNRHFAKPVLSAGVFGVKYPIVCVRGYEFEGTIFNKGDVSDHCWGRNIPDGWSRANDQDIINYQNQRR